MNTNGKLYFYEIIGVFFILTLYYFIAEHSSWFIAMPTLFLGLATLAHSREGGWAIPAALFLSAIGDYQGSEHNFILQVLFFALAHIFYIVDFLPKRLSLVGPVCARVKTSGYSLIKRMPTPCSTLHCSTNWQS